MAERGKVTAGPWQGIGEDDGDFMIFGPGDAFVANVGEQIQQVSANPRADLVCFDVDEANMKFILAAANACFARSPADPMAAAEAIAAAFDLARELDQIGASLERTSDGGGPSSNSLIGKARALLARMRE